MAVVMLPLDATAGSPSFAAQATRQAFSAFLGVAPSGRPLGAVSGVRPGTPTTTVFLSGGGSTTWNVAAHSGVLDTQTSAAAGPYAYATNGTDAGAITAANGSNPRVDIIYVKVNDNVQDGSGLTSGQVLYLAGTAASSPVAPTVPARGMVLARINVPTSGGGAPTVSWVAPIFGGPQSDAGTLVLGGIRLQWGGSGTITGSSANAHSTTITFPVAFSAAPQVFVSGAAAAVVGYSHATETATNFSLYSWWTDGTSHTSFGSATWFAVGPV